MLALDDGLRLLAYHWPWAAPILGGILGAVMGSFANCLRYRLPRRLSLRQPPSSCPSCRRVLSAVDLVPIVSWLYLLGRCRSCNAIIGFSSPVIESSMAMTGCAMGWAIGLHIYTLPVLVVGLAAVAWGIARLFPQR